MTNISLTDMLWYYCTAFEKIVYTFILFRGSKQISKNSSLSHSFFPKAIIFKTTISKFHKQSLFSKIGSTFLFFNNVF